MSESAFKIKADSEHIAINEFVIAPAEAAALKEVISFAGGMREFPALPEKISIGPFSVWFNEDGSLVANRTVDFSRGRIDFDFNSVDALIVALTSAVEISIDKKRLSPSPRLSGSVDMFNSGDVIIGR